MEGDAGKGNAEEWAAHPPISWQAPTGPPRASPTGPPDASPDAPSAAAGWYPDPLDTSRRRWWNGDRWIDHWQGEPRRYDPSPGWVLLGGASAIVLGSFLPWAKATAPFVGTFEVTGTDGGDGFITIVLGILIVLLGFPLVRGPMQRERARLVVVLVLAIVAGGVCLFEIADADRRVREAEETSELVNASVGYGLWLIGLGALSAVGGAAVALMRARKAARR